MKKLMITALFAVASLTVAQAQETASQLKQQHRIL